MIRGELQKFVIKHNLNRIFLSIRNKTSSIDIQKLEKESQSNIDVVDEELKAREEEIERKRNKSRLRVRDRDFLLEKNPYPEPAKWHHGTLKYLRRLYGRYGQASGVNPSICWPVKEELEEKKEYERIAYPFTISKVMEEVKIKAQEKNEKIRLRQEEMVKKMGKVEEMKQDMHNRIRKKENEALAAKERKERLIEEVRMHFGYTVDPRDDKFKELLEKKEKEQKKALRDAKRKERDESMVAKLLSKKSHSSKKEDTEKQ